MSNVYRMFIHNPRWPHLLHYQIEGHNPPRTVEQLDKLNAAWGSFDKRNRIGLFSPYAPTEDANHEAGSDVREEVHRRPSH